MEYFENMTAEAMREQEVQADLMARWILGDALQRAHDLSVHPVCLLAHIREQIDRRLPHPPRARKANP